MNESSAEDASIASSQQSGNSSGSSDEEEPSFQHESADNSSPSKDPTAIRKKAFHLLNLIGHESDEDESTWPSDPSPNSSIPSADQLLPKRTNNAAEPKPEEKSLQAASKEISSARPFWKRKWVIGLGIVLLIIIVVVVAVLVVSGGDSGDTNNLAAEEDSGNTNSKNTATPSPTASPSALRLRATAAPTLSPTAAGTPPPPKTVRINSKGALFSAVDDYLEAFLTGTLRGKRHDLTQWNVSAITDFSRVFDVRRNPNATYFNDPGIAFWDVSNAVTMNKFFRGAAAFDQDLQRWKTDQVQDFELAFADATAFRGRGLNEWNTANAVTMQGMFWGASSMAEDLDQWVTSKVTTFQDMFRGALVFNGKVVSWDTSAAVSLDSMFQDAQLFRQDIGQWKTNKVTDMSSMLSGAALFNRDLSGWDVSNVQSMARMFQGAVAFAPETSLNAWQTGKVTNMENMFFGAEVFNAAIGEWDVSKVETMQTMFKRASVFNQDVGSWNTASLTNVKGMFQRADAFNQDLSSWIVTGVQDATQFLQGAASFDQNLCAWNQQITTTPLLVEEMFLETACPAPEDPVPGVGPFCHVC